MRKWRIEDSAELYNIGGWGLKYFSINDKGNVQVVPRQDYAPIDLKEVMDDLRLRDVTAPVLLRFPDILDDRIQKITNCFRKAAQEYSYKGQNFVVYPIKVNQMRQVVEEIVSHGNKYNIGLEAGSKPELHAVLGVNAHSNSVIICNGYKDEDYIELALLAQKMGCRIYLVVEKLHELRRIFEVAKRVNVRPNIGIRIKITSSGSGKWEESGGDVSKFGLNSSELLEALEFLRQNEMSDCLKLIHFHIGSQITKIRRIKNALREAMQFYVQLSKMNFSVEFVDIGGGLGVDYDGTRSASGENSMNYSIQEYVNDSVAALVDVCVKNDLPHPNIITESGRSVTAHHSVLVIEVLEATQLPEWKEDIDTISGDAHELTTRAQIEKLFWSVARDVNEISQSMKHPPEELRKVARMLPEKYFCNFSLFQSLPDSWAIDQLFPVMPISGLDQKPTQVCTIQDVTCDSDGKINRFVSPQGVSYSLPVHKFSHGGHYYIGVFLVGAYQEILGDLHNLFGDTAAVHITGSKTGYQIEQVIDGEPVADVLDYVEYNTKKLVRNLETWVSRSVKEGSISAEEGRQFLNIYRSGLYGITYLEERD